MRPAIQEMFPCSTTNTSSGYKLMGIVPNFLARRPHVAELDLAGIVVDSNGTEFRAGDKVFGCSNIGTLAQYVTFPSSSLALAPPNVSAVEAAGLGVVIVTAYQALVKDLKIESGQTVFINGGSSGVGLSAIQIAKSMGCRVVATASGKNKALLLGLGVDEVFFSCGCFWHLSNSTSS
jgi:NADPH:quinone reductase-like Zn-dependent oxidoreductase